MNSSERTNDRVPILIAEDSPTQAAQLRHLLEQHRFVVTAARNGREALALLDRCSPTLVIGEALMPELDGYSLCKAIKASEEWKHVPVMLTTTLSDVQDVVRGLECGVDSFIRKPYDEKTLLSRVDYLLTNVELRKNQRMETEVGVRLGGQMHRITSERQQMLDLLISTYEQAVQVNEELRLREEDLAHSNQMLSGLYSIAEGLNQAGSEREVAELAVERAQNLPGIKAAWISLREGEHGFRLAAARNLPPALEVPGAMDGDCACRRRLLSGALDSVTNILECERLQEATGDTGGLRYHASVPLWVGDRTLGVMNLVGPGKGLFKEDELQVLYGVGNQLAMALERARLREHLEQLVEERTARIDRVNGIYAVLSGINTAILRVRERQQLFEETCRIAVEQGKFTFVWVGMLEGSTQEVTPVAKAGLDDGYLSQINLAAVEDASGISALTARTLAGAVPVVCQDIASDERMRTWRAAALERGYRSVALFPLLLHRRPVGLLVLYAPEPGYFDAEEMRLLVEMVDDISFALDHLEKEKLLELQTAALNAEIADRTRIEERLRASEEKFRALVENSLDGIILLDLDGKIRYASPAVSRILGYEVIDVLGLNPFSLIHPDDLAYARERLAAVLTEGVRPILAEFRVRHKDGTWRWLEFLRSNFGNDTSGPAIVLNYRDVTESRLSRDALDQLRRRYELILSCAAEGILGLDVEGRIVFANAAAEAIFGWSTEEFENIDAHQRIHHTTPDGAPYPASECPINLMLIDGKTRSVNNELFWRRNGESFPVEYTCSPMYDGTAVIGGVVTVKDVSEQRELQRRLDQVQRVDSLGRVAATIAHEFNNVLMGIEPFAEVIRRRAGQDQRISNAAEQISKSVDRGKHVTEDILRFTRPIEPQREVTDMARWVAAIEPELRSVAGSAVQLTVQVPKKQLFTRCDAAQMQQVMANLVINARHAMPSGGAVTVTLATCIRETNPFIGLSSEHERFVQLTVRDTGSGIAPDLLEQVFEPLFTTKRSGTGLGLAVARQVVTQHDGFIFAENAPGGGTAFDVLLPQVD